MSKPKQKRRVSATSYRWLEIAAERIRAGEPEAQVLADYGYIPEGKPPLATFEAWVSENNPSGPFWSEAKQAQWVGSIFKPIRVRVTVEEL